MFTSRILSGLILASLMFLAVACGASATILPATSPALSPTAAATAGPVSFAPTSAAAASPASTAPPPTSAPTLAPVAGSTSGDSTIRLKVVPEKSQANYRVREQLATLSLPSDAIGKTNQITGTIIGKSDGTILSPDSKFVVNLASLESDRSQRDNFLRRNVLQTDQYPDATFVPTEAPGLHLPLPSSGQVAFKLTGDLTVRNVTKPVTWDVTCQAQGTNEGTCHATTSFTFEYMNLTQPHVSVVLSVVDSITLEMDVDLQQVGS